MGLSLWPTARSRHPFSLSYLYPRLSHQELVRVDLTLPLSLGISFTALQMPWILCLPFDHVKVLSVAIFCWLKRCSFVISKQTAQWEPWWTAQVAPETSTTTCQARPPRLSPRPRTSNPSACLRPAETTARETRPIHMPSIKTERWTWAFCVSKCLSRTLSLTGETYYSRTAWRIRFFGFKWACQTFKWKESW